MDLLLLRERPDDHRTHGDLYVLKPGWPTPDRAWECFTLEDPVRVDDPSTPANEGEKIPGRTAIPAGRYRVAINYSPHFHTHLPELQAVPGFSGIRIHAGNTEADTQGCILVGQERTAASILRSRAALKALEEKIFRAFGANEEVWIEIKNAEGK